MDGIIAIIVMFFVFEDEATGTAIKHQQHLPMPRKGTLQCPKYEDVRSPTLPAFNVDKYVLGCTGSTARVTCGGALDFCVLWISRLC